MLATGFIGKTVNTLEQNNRQYASGQTAAYGGPYNGSEIWIKLEGNNPAGSVKIGRPVDDCRGRKARRLTR